MQPALLVLELNAGDQANDALVYVGGFPAVRMGLLHCEPGMNRQASSCGTIADGSSQDRGIGNQKQRQRALQKGTWRQVRKWQHFLVDRTRGGIGQERETARTPEAASSSREEPRLAVCPNSSHAQGARPNKGDPVTRSDPSHFSPRPPRCEISEQIDKGGWVATKGCILPVYHAVKGYINRTGNKDKHDTSP
ncbi:hypothetical protein BaRGS_00034841, partial [Batillaria attramentaria]